MSRPALTRSLCAGMTTALLSIGSAAFGQQPPDIVHSANGNTAMGDGALISNTTGASNTAAGESALAANTTGSINTAIGSGALTLNTAGAGNTAAGVSALLANTTGNYNTAIGLSSLGTNTIGSDNTATGTNALAYNTTGTGNTAGGEAALGNSTTGSYNTAHGYASLNQNTTGTYNTATGVNALIANTAGSGNTATGFAVLSALATGDNNTAYGNVSFNALTTGTFNIAVGAYAGANLTSGSNNIDIGNNGVAKESNTIRIGTAARHSKTYIAGIWGSVVHGLPVFANSDGELGVVVSSERYKTGITSMGTNTDKLRKLRPVTFHLKSDPHGAVQYGLIAEEVDKVYPELVIRDKTGKIQGVRYDELAPMLLNEVQQQQAQLARQNANLRDMRQQLAALKQANESVQAAMAKLLPTDARVAMQ